MIDREKVIYGLEIQLDDLQKYADNDQPLTLTQEQAQEIISLLKEQEPHEITKDEWESWKKAKYRDPLCMYWRGDITPLWILRPEEVHEPAYLVGDIKIFKGKPDKKKMHEMWLK